METYRPEPRDDREGRTPTKGIPDMTRLPTTLVLASLAVLPSCGTRAAQPAPQQPVYYAQPAYSEPGRRAGCTHPIPVGGECTQCAPLATAAELAEQEYYLARVRAAQNGEPMPPQPGSYKTEQPAYEPTRYEPTPTRQPPWADMAVATMRINLRDEGYKHTLATSIRNLSHPSGKSPELVESSVLAMGDGSLRVTVNVRWRGGVVGGYYSTQVEWSLSRRGHIHAEVKGDNSVTGVSSGAQHRVDDYFRRNVLPSLYDQVGR